MATDEREPDQVIERALVRIRRVQQSRRLQRRAAGGDPAAASAASAARFRYLDALEGAREGLAISQIADAIDVDRPRASRLTGELLADGLIERETAPGDSRYARIRLTAEGEDFVDRVHASRRRAVAEALSGFTGEEARTLAALLERFVAAWPQEPPPR
ncbi:MarR family transcriptional regulator [Glycomyces sp. A-F 0318]|uniref:MarR family winged helix-turn-helix transcriptional regulator n=1 Tax=Glycomyces amatae TaxID=2881355 RepID=UPI001E321BEF|nr:MarR family transcriptional regulator [Glycomyces amatae]MCD0442629.1 MarR family transcriptional regulator [Glycomyces amatae]